MMIMMLTLMIPGTMLCSSNTTACTASGESWMDPERYVGLNGSRLCCRLVDPLDTSQVIREQCSQPLRLVPGELSSYKS